LRLVHYPSFFDGGSRELLRVFSPDLRVEGTAVDFLLVFTGLLVLLMLFVIVLVIVVRR